MRTTKETRVLDRALEQIKKGLVFEGLDEMAIELGELRSRSEASDWRSFCRNVVPAHPLWPVVQQAPFTHRAFEKPRGYPGDAVVLDWIYGFEHLDRDAGPALREIHRWERQTPSCVSVRNRKTILAELIDAVAARAGRPIRVLAVACGHLREAAESAAVRSGGVAELLALDQDQESLNVARTMAPVVRPIQGSVRGILSNKVRFSGLDLVYAAGLYDYLGGALAAELTGKLFGMLGRGGTLLVANFSPELRDIGYLEAYMDWQLTYRTDGELADCAAAIPAAQIHRQRVFRESAGNIAFLEIDRAE